MKRVIGDAVIYRGDCLVEMGKIADGSVDLIFADLPYGVTACGWDQVIDFDRLWAHYKRVIRSGAAIVLTASQPFTTAVVLSNRPWFRYEWILRKNRPTGFLDARRRPLKDNESALVFCERRQPTYYPRMVPCKPRILGGRKSHSTVYNKFSEAPRRVSKAMFPRSVLSFDWTKRRSGHPTEKPVELAEYMIRTYTRRGQLVLDNTMGGGSCGVAAIRTLRRFIGIERDPKYFKIAERLIREG